MGLMFLTAYKIGASRKGVFLTTPRVIQVNSSEIIRTIAIPSTAAVGGHYKPGTTKIEVDNGNGGTQVYGVYETLAQIEVAKNPATTNPYAQDMNLSVSGHGATKAVATALTKYLNKITPVSSSDAVKMPAPAANKPYVLINAGTVAAKVFSYTSDKFPGLDSDTSYSLAAGKRVHVVTHDGVNHLIAKE